MHCVFPYQASPNFNVTWTHAAKGEERVLFVSSYLEFIDLRSKGLAYNYTDEYYFGTFIGPELHLIQLFEVAEKDDGEYACIVDTEHSTLKASKTLEVVESQLAEQSNWAFDPDLENWKWDRKLFIIINFNTVVQLNSSIFC